MSLQDDHNRLLGDHPVGLLAAMGVGAALIGLGTIAVEILTGQMPARVLGLGIGFVSLPLGAAASICGLLTLRQDWRYATPALLLSIVYWSLFASYL